MLKTIQSTVVLFTAAVFMLFSTTAFAQQEKPEFEHQINKTETGISTASTGPVTITFSEAEGYVPGFLGGQQDWEIISTSYGGSVPDFQASQFPAVSPDDSFVGDWSMEMNKDPNWANDAIAIARKQVGYVDGEGYYSLSFDVKVTATGGADFRFYAIDLENETFVAQLQYSWTGERNIFDYSTGEAIGEQAGNWVGSDEFVNIEIRLTPFESVEYFVDGASIGVVEAPIFADGIDAIDIFFDNWFEDDIGYVDNIQFTREVMEEVVPGPFALLSPENEAQITVGPDDESIIQASWEASANADFYTWRAIAPGGDFAEPTLALPADSDGTGTTITLPAFAVYAQLVELDFEPGDSVVLEWTVWATAGDSDPVQADQVWTLFIEMEGDGTSVDPGTGLPTRFALNNNYPNPFNPTTNISFDLPQTSEVTIEVFNIQGQRVATLVNGTMNAGTQTVAFDASGLSSGIYLYRMTAGNFTQTNKMMLVK